MLQCHDTAISHFIKISILSEAMTITTLEVNSLATKSISIVWSLSFGGDQNEQH